MADTLFPAALQGQEAALQGANANADRQQETQKEGVDAGKAASSNLAGERQQAMSGQQAQQLAQLKDKLDQASNMVTITPQIALGLVKNTGNKEWLKAIGQKQRADVVLSFMRDGINKRIAGKEYTTSLDGKDYRIGMNIDDNGDPQPSILSIGDTPVSKTGADTDKAKADRASREKIAHDKAAADARKSATTKMDPKDTEFEKTYRSYAKDTEGMNGTLLTQLGKKDPARASELQKKMDFIQKNQDRFNKLQGTSGASPGGAGGPPSGDNQKAVDYLKKNYPQLTNPTPEDIKWAQSKLNG